MLITFILFSIGYWSSDNLFFPLKTQFKYKGKTDQSFHLYESLAYPKEWKKSTWTDV